MAGGKPAASEVLEIAYEVRLVAWPWLAYNMCMYMSLSDHKALFTVLMCL